MINKLTLTHYLFFCDTIPFKRTRHSGLLSSYTVSVSQVFLVFDNHYNLYLPLFLPFSLSTSGPARATQFSNTDLHPSPTRAIRAILLHSIQGACHRYDLIMTIGSISAGGCFPGFLSLKQFFLYLHLEHTAWKEKTLRCFR